MCLLLVNFISFMYIKNIYYVIFVQVLLQNSTLSQETRDNLEQGVHKLTDSTQMGERFKFFSMFPKVLEQHLKRFPVAGFSS
jgi:hypothetical protein